MSLSFVRPIARSCSSIGSASQAPRSCRYFCTIDVAAAGEAGDPRRRSGPPPRAAAPSGFSVPSTNPSRSRSSNDLKPCTSSTTWRCPRSRLDQPLRELEAQVQRGARGCGTAGRRASRRRVCRAPTKLAERMQPGRARAAEQPIPQPAADADDAGQPALGDAEADRPHQPARRPRAGRGLRPRRRRRRSARGRSPPRSAGSGRLAARLAARRPYSADPIRAGHARSLTIER